MLKKNIGIIILLALIIEMCSILVQQIIMQQSYCIAYISIPLYFIAIESVFCIISKNKSSITNILFAFKIGKLLLSLSFVGIILFLAPYETQIAFLARFGVAYLFFLVLETYIATQKNKNIK